MFSISIKSFKQIFSGKIVIILLCLSVALCIWGVSHIQKESICELQLPLEIRNLPPGFVPLTTPRGLINISLSGPEKLLKNVITSNPTLVISMQGTAAPGKTVFSHLDANLKLPERVRTIRISPATLQVELIKSKQATEGER